MKKNWSANFLLLIFSCLLGGSTSYVIGNIIFSTYHINSVFNWGLLLLLIVLIFFLSLRYHFKKVKNKSFVSLNIYIFIFFLLSAPVIVTNFDHYLSIPTKKEQNKTIEQISTILKQTGLPYEIDVSESKKQTKEYGVRVTIVLVRILNGQFKRNEVDTLLEKLPDVDIHITFYTKERTAFLGVVLDKNKSITSCSPFEMCKSMGINY